MAQYHVGRNALSLHSLAAFVIYEVVLLCVSYTTRFAYLPRAVVDIVESTSSVVLSGCPSTSNVAVAAGSYNVGVIVVGGSSFSVDGVEPASVCVGAVDSTPFGLVGVCSSAAIVLSVDPSSTTIQNSMYKLMCV